MKDLPAGASVYSDYIAEQVKREDDRKSSLESRGLSVITTSGALTTLLFALAAVSTQVDSFQLSGWSRGFLIAAVVTFLGAAGFAIATNYPLDYDEVKPSELRDAVKNRWSDDERVAERMTSFTRLKVLETARSRNDLKAELLLWATGLEVAGVACVAVAVIFILS